MSSNTRVRVLPPPPPPPIIESDIRGGQSVSLDTILGMEGREMLTGLLKSLPTNIGKIEGVQKLNADSRALLNWKPDPSDPERFTLTLSGSLVPSEARSLGVTSIPVTLRVGGSTAETSFDMTIRKLSEISMEQRQVVNQAVQRVVNRSVNQVLAVGVQQQIATKLKQRVGTELKHTVQNRVAQRVSNRVTHRTRAKARLSR